MSAVNELKSKIMSAYRETVREVDLLVAHSLLRFLSDSERTLGLSDVTYRVERLLESLGCKIYYSHNYSLARVYLAPES